MALAAAGFGSLASCSDFLKEEPYSYVGIDEVGNDDAAVGLWVTGVYSKWVDDMARWGNFPRLLDMDCDYVSGPDWAFSNLGAGNFQGDEVVNTLWNGCYNLINRANVAIANVNNITGADEAVKQNGLGEIYFNKAFAYFLLVRAYGDIPLFDTSIDNGADYDQPRRPIADVYKEIIRILEEEAIPRLYKNTDAGYQVGHVCAGTAVALLAKVYATMGAASMPLDEAAARVLPVRSSTNCTYICLLLLNTVIRGRSAVPETLPRMRVLILSLLSIFVVMIIPV